MVIDVDSNSNSASDKDSDVRHDVDKPTKVAKSKRKSIMCRDTSTFITGQKCAAVESDKLVVVNKNFKKKKACFRTAKLGQI